MRDRHHAPTVANAEVTPLDLASRHARLDDLAGLRDGEPRRFGVLRGRQESIGRGFDAAVGQGSGEVC